MRRNAQRPFHVTPLLPVPALLPIELSAPPPALPFVRSDAAAMSAEPVLPEFQPVELQAARLMAISTAIGTPWYFFMIAPLMDMCSESIASRTPGST
jgi:hypothetical protein